MKILAIDDDLEMRVIVAHYLDQAGHEVIEASSGEDGLQAAFEHTPDLILLDAIMGQMHGPEVLVQLRQDARTRSIPVIFVTVLRSKADMERLMAFGAVGVIGKPFNPVTLHQDIKRILSETSEAS